MWFSERMRKAFPWLVTALSTTIVLWSSCTQPVAQSENPLMEKFPEKALPWVLTEKSFYEYGEWLWHDSVVERRHFPVLSEDDLKLMHDTVGILPEGLVGRFIAVQKATDSRGYTVFMYRNDVSPFDDELGPDTLDHKFVVAVFHPDGHFLDRRILARWQPNYGLLTGSIDERFQIRTIWVSQVPGEDSVRRNWRWTSSGKWQEIKADPK